MKKRQIIPILYIFALSSLFCTGATPSDIIDKHPAERHRCGGYTDWRKPEPEEKTMLCKLTKESGVSYSSIAVRTQVVAGINYNFKCRFKDKRLRGECHITVHRPTQGDPVILRIDNPEWTSKEIDLIEKSGPVMRVLSIDSSEDKKILRKSSDTLSARAIRSSTYQSLRSKMLSTVTDPSQDGVGIAGPQVGISRRIVAVQRFDKKGEPFEVYPNIVITKYNGQPVFGPEGCLSLAGRRSDVPRSRDIEISYTSPRTLKDTSEHVCGFTAVIFQHECDHLDGIVFTDRVWEQEAEWFKAGDPYNKADVFYVTSTNVIESRLPDGRESNNAQLLLEEREKMRVEMQFARDSLFGPAFNFFSPFYHQVTMNGFKSERKEYVKAYGKARLEVLDAFDHYMAHENGGRPFIIAGFSQGAMMVKEILRHLDAEQRSKLIASYLIGCGVSAEEASHPNFKAADNEDGTGVYISFNSVADTSAIWKAVHLGSVECINPVNWKTDSTTARFDFRGEELSVQSDTRKKVLVVKGHKENGNGFSEFWPKGCLHGMDIVFYSKYIRQNAERRAGNAR